MAKDKFGGRGDVMVELLESAPTIPAGEDRPLVHFMGYDETQLREIVSAYNQQQDQMANFYGETLAAETPDTGKPEPDIFHEDYQRRHRRETLIRIQGKIEGAGEQMTPAATFRILYDLLYVLLDMLD